MGKYYSMTLVWQIKPKFIFKSWEPQSLTTFLIGCFITFSLAVLSMALPIIRQKLEQILFQRQESSQNSYNFRELQENRIKKDTIHMSGRQLLVRDKIIPFFYSFVYAFLHVVIMIIMMSMNGYVILAIIAGYTTGFAFFDKNCNKKSKQSCHGACNQ